MGCDIHWHSETLIDGKWVCDQAASYTPADPEDQYSGIEMDDFPNRNRDYWWFGLLAADVRVEYPWSFPYQGIVPPDLSAEVAAMVAQMAGDGHSHGTHTRADLKAKREELKPLQTEYLISPPTGDIDHYANVVNHHAQRLDQAIANLSADVPDTDQRIVFWFDN